MAKIGILKTLLVAALLGWAGTAVFPAYGQTGEELLDKAQAAESQKYWSAAEKFYRQFLQRNPGRADLWERLGDIIAAQGRPRDAAEAFGRAADLAANDARIQTKAANAFSAVSEPEKAIHYLARAVAIDSSNSLNWYSKSANESWIGRYADAEASLKQAFAAGLPRNVDNLVRLATLQQWQNKTEEANATLEEVYRMDPEDPQAILAMARLNGWRGNYHRALEFLEDYKARGGDELTHAQELSILLAWADKPDRSLAVSDRALQEHPKDKNLGLGQVIAFSRAREYDTAFDILEGLEEQTGPDIELAEIRRRISAPLRSNFRLETGFATDRDNIDTIGGEMVYSQALDRGTFLRFGFEGYYIKADRFSGLDRVDNNQRIVKRGAWAEIETNLAKNVWGSVRAGGSFSNFQSVNRNIAQIGAELNIRAHDNLWLKFGYDRDHFIVSPRTFSLGIVRNEEFVEFIWTPDTRWYVQLRLSAFQNSDTNREKRADLTIIRAISRQPNLKVDAGFNAIWYGYKFQLGNGYYDPEFYQRYLFPIYFTIKISDDDNVVLTFAPGMQKDETFSNFHFAGVGTLETTHGLFRDWFVKTKWSVYVGGSESALALVPLTDYWIVSGNIAIVRRF